MATHKILPILKIKLFWFPGSIRYILENLKVYTLVVQKSGIIGIWRPDNRVLTILRMEW